jgi:hypothetical protein
MIPRADDNSKAAQVIRIAAVEAYDCPRCGARAGAACYAKSGRGGSYDPAYTVHAARLKAADPKRYS